MQLKLFGNITAIEKPPEKPEEVADVTWDQWTSWRKAPFICEWCGKAADSAGMTPNQGPWRVHIGCERLAAYYHARGVMEEARRLLKEGK